MNPMQKMKELVKKLNEADAAYFQKDNPIMTDREYDAMLLELTMLERATGIHFADSPVGRVAADAKEGLQTVRHSKPMLSCQKTKDVGEVLKFSTGYDTVVSWKMDGLTLVLRYEGGRFQQAITRGADGVIGEDVSHTVRHLRNIPEAVPCKESFEVRGEGVISWEDHKLLTRLHGGTSHPRSVASGAVRALVPDKGKLDHIDFIAFELIKENAPTTKMEQLAFLKANHFDVVQHESVSCSDGPAHMTELLQTWTPDGFRYPVDGVVVEYDDIAYGKSLGATAHHEKRMLALKWQDEMKTTVFRGVELNTTRTGAVSIVAKFDEVILDGTRIHRANLHNLGNFENYQFGVGDIIRVYKANMIIPQVADNLTRSGTYELPRHCPCCGTELTVRITSGGVKELYCPNENCIARNARKIARFCDKNAMNIDGFSASVVENLMAYGWIKGFKDLYQLHLHKEEIINTPGFGPERYLAMEQAIDKSRKCLMRQFLVGIGIPLMGSEAAKLLHQYYYGSMGDFEQAIKDGFRFSHIAGISEAVERSIYTWYEDPMNQKTLHALMAELEFIGTRASGDGTNPFRDMQVVVTGTFNGFSRSEILELLESLGAITDNTVSENTDYLIYGAMPGSKKVGAALEHGVNMISEKSFAEMLQQNR